MIKIYYYDFKFWRFEVLKAGLFLQNIPFETVFDMGAMAKAPFNAFPLIELEDGQILCQSQAMATYVGKLGSSFDYVAAGVSAEKAAYARLYPADDDILAQFRCDEIINGANDVTNTVAGTFSTPQDQMADLAAALIKPDGGRLFMHLKGLDSLLCKDSVDFACGKTLTVADLAIWRFVAWFEGERIAFVPVEFPLPAGFIESNFPNLQKIYTKVQENENVAEYVKAYYKE